MQPFDSRWSPQVVLENEVETPDSGILSPHLAMWLSWYPDSGFDLGNAKVSAQMRKVEWADGSRDFDERDLSRPGEKDSDVADSFVLPMNPKIGGTGQAIAVALVDQLHPSGRVVLVRKGTHGFWI